MALSLAMGSHVVAAVAADQPTAFNMIFEHKHLSNTEAGQEIKYKFNRTVSDVTVLGQPFSDQVTIKVVAANPAGERDVDLQIYAGERARDLKKLPGLTINPVFNVYFAQGVSSFSMLAGGQMTYLQHAFSMGFRNKAKVEPVKVDYMGKSIDAHRISMTPYLGDVNESKMQGWEDAQYALVVSDQVPGEIVDLTATYKNKFRPELKVEERYTLDGISGLEGSK
jgi:hypothetical protein